MRHRNPFSFLFVVALIMGPLVLPACSGGSSASVTPVPTLQNLNLGLVRADEPTTIALPLHKPFYDAATIELAAPPAGPFQPVASLLPMLVERGEDAQLWITFAPPVSPVDPLQHGTIDLVFRRTYDGESLPVTVNLEAQIEIPSVRLLQNHFDMGRAAVGESVPFGIYVENTSKATPIVVTGITSDNPAFRLAQDAYGMPCPTGPGSRFFIRMVYEPQVVGLVSTVIHVAHSVPNAPLDVTATGTGIADRVVTDYGFVPLDPATSESEWLTVDVGPEAVGISIEAWGDPLSLLDLIGLEGPDGTVYATSDLKGPLHWLNSYPAGADGYLNVKLPDSTKPEVQLVPGGGTYRFQLRDSAFAASGLFVQATVVQRRGASAQLGTLDLRVFHAHSLGFPLQPMEDPAFATAMKALDALLGESGIRVGEITFVPLAPVYDTISSPQATEDLFAINTAGLPEGPLNLFFVQSMTYGSRGIAGAVPGPTANGTPYSGVVVDFNETYWIMSGATAAHEIAHYLGVNGKGVVLMPDEAYPAVRHPILRAGLPDDLLSPPESTNEPQLNMYVDAMGQMGNWCGTCVRPPLR